MMPIPNLFRESRKRSIEIIAGGVEDQDVGVVHLIVAVQADLERSGRLVAKASAAGAGRGLAKR
jgi:hypothetical protein